jgi:two-component system phosphate regulon sensor histidine kinase PhoR
MRAGLWLATTAAIGGVPTLLLALLVLIGAASPGPTLLALAVVVLTSALLAEIWVRDTVHLEATLRHAAQENSLALSHSAGAPRLPPIERITRGIEGLARALAARAVQVERSLRATETIVDQLPDPLLVLGADRAVRRANAAARRAFGGDIPAVLRHPGLRAAIDRSFAQEPTGGTPQTADLTIPVPVPREVQATVLVIDPPLADGGRALVVLSDRTRERAVERMRADFIANASHELRTPLASLMGFIDTLRGPAADDPPAQQRFLGIMAEQAERMNRLIDDLLSLSRIEVTEHQPPSQRVDVASAALRIAAAFEPRLAARQVRLQLDLAEGLPQVTADPDQLEQVLQNLIDNAVKYGREGGLVRLAVNMAKPGRWPNRPGVVVAVSDEGPGIARHHVVRLTERFYRVDKGRSRSAGGTGLGLAIVKHIVNRHRGHLLIDSEEGKGSTFSVWLPVAERDPAR